MTYGELDDPYSGCLGAIAQCAFNHPHPTRPEGLHIGYASVLVPPENPDSLKGCIFLVPGLTADSEYYFMMMKAIAAAGYDVHVVDLIGQGRSPYFRKNGSRIIPGTPIDYHTSYVTQFIDEVLQKYPERYKGKKINLAGHSLGGLICMHMLYQNYLEDKDNGNTEHATKPAGKGTLSVEFNKIYFLNAFFDMYNSWSKYFLIDTKLLNFMPPSDIFYGYSHIIRPEYSRYVKEALSGAEDAVPFQRWLDRTTPFEMTIHSYALAAQRNLMKDEGFMEWLGDRQNLHFIIAEKEDLVCNRAIEKIAMKVGSNIVGYDGIHGGAYSPKHEEVLFHALVLAGLHDNKPPTHILKKTMAHEISFTRERLMNAYREHLARNNKGPALVYANG